MSDETHMTSDERYRSPTDWEGRLLGRLVSVEFPGQKEVAEQLRSCGVRTIDREGGLAFEIHTETLAPVEKRIPVEAEAKDTDGQMIHALLHVVNGKVRELEIYKEDGSLIEQDRCLLDWEVIVLPAAPSVGWRLGTRPN